MSTTRHDKQAENAPEIENDAMPTQQDAGTDTSNETYRSLSLWRRTLAASRALQVLGVLLVGQLVLAGGLYWGSSRDGDFVSADQQLVFDDSQAERLQIDSADRQLTLIRTGDGWQLQGDHDLPADQLKVDQLLKQLSDLKAGLPVATTRAAREQLDVAEDDFQRHIRVLQGEQMLADVYVGTSPGYQKAHLRQAGQDAIVAARLNVHDVPDTVDGWMERALLSFDDVVRIQTEEFTLARVGDEWTIEAPQALVADHVVAEEPMDKLLTVLQGLRVTGLAVDQQELETETDATSTETAEAVDEAGEAEEESVLVWTVTEEGGEPLTLTLNKQGNDVTMERSDWPLTFKAPVSAFNDLSDVDPAVLLPRAVSDESGDESSNESVSVE